MTDPAEDLTTTRGAASSHSRPSQRRVAGSVTSACPLLVSADAAWRSAYASREHRCWAVRPPAPLALAKQRDLCLRSEHSACVTYLATRWETPADDVATERSGADAGSLLWPRVRSTPLALEPSRGRTGALPTPSVRAGGQALLVGLMVLAFVVVVIARATAPSDSPPAGPGGPGAIGESPSSSLSPSPAQSVTPSSAPTATPPGTPLPTPGASGTPGASVAPSQPTPIPSGARRYTVQSGDTLSGIAARFGTTVKAIAAANGITDPSRIRIGQVLVIP